MSRLVDLTRWCRGNSTFRANANKSNVINQQYRIPQIRIEKALLDYASGRFQCKRDVARKHQISTRTLTRYADLYRVDFVKYIATHS
ncbi:hypothetical protein AB4355_13885 [Vibrio sp. 10N.261.49.A12]|uniref:hypothetical protein n=1 Tax=Vibrio sp. 10N.261.49.A12 TaxID=3229667 RepID=UPI00354AFAD8